MFKLTKQERTIVALIAGAMILGSVVGEWRARQTDVTGSAQSAARQNYGED